MTGSASDSRPLGDAASAVASSSASTEPERYSDRWEAIWSAGLQPGQRWDASCHAPATEQLLQSGQLDVKRKRVLVPGCGRGYDLVLFHRCGAARVVGLELSPTATAAAREYVAGQLGAAGGGAADPAQGAVAVEQGDFFVWEDGEGPGSWDVGYDYTFGCAMDPPSRTAWAQHWARHVRPGGLLVTLVFPIDPSADQTAGPPFPVSTALYRQLLEPHGFEVVYQQPVPRAMSNPPVRAGKEEMMMWRKRA